MQKIIDLTWRVDLQTADKLAHFTAGTYPVNFVGMTGLPCRVVARV